VAELPEDLQQLAPSIIELPLQWELIVDETEVVPPDYEGFPGPDGGPPIKMSAGPLLSVTYGYRAPTTRSPGADGKPVYDLKMQVRATLEILKDQKDPTQWLVGVVRESMERDLGDIVKMWVKGGGWTSTTTTPFEQTG
jgi:hypothetical protein